ncbi:hypothetical protein [Streptomyces sp. enrichment culture]|uniref:hypothetical protein n=1 Tax=Streptomyces sp. enrichment culture TaxID=1795815 RepID=UPI003F57019B
MNVEQWNARHPVGTLVLAYPGVRPEDGTGTRLVTRTRTEAQLSASGDPVVWVEGEGAYICLTHVDPVAEDVWEAAREAEKQAEPAPARLTPEREAAAYRASEDALQRQIDEQAKEIDRLRSELAAYRALELGALDDRVSASCSQSGHPTWLRAKDDYRTCPWCRVAELERPEIEATRNKVRDSYAELIAQCEKDRDYEGAFDVQCRLADREAQWRREDEAAS